MFVCISRPSAPNDVIDVTPYEQYTISDFSKIIKLSNKVFSIKTPFYREKLSDDVQPFIKYPELINDRNEGIPNYPIPDICLLIDEPSQPEYSLFLMIETQMKDIEFPKMEVEFNTDELIIWNAKDFVSRCIEKFNFECTDTFLVNSNDQIIDEQKCLNDIYEMSKNSKLTFRCTIDESCIEKILRRKYIVEEIIDTEEIFVKNMQLLHDYWWPKFEESEIFDRFQLNLIFKDIDPILNTHKDLFKMENKQKKNYATEIGPLFLNFIERFKVAIPFFTNFKRVDDMVQKKRLSSKHVEKKFEEINENNPDKEGGDFFSYYITPIQRYPRYTLLIRDLDKHTPAFHPDKPYLELAQETLIVANKEIDETSQRVKQLLYLGEIQKTLPDDFSVLKNDRTLIDRKKILIHKKLNAKKGIIYLFNDTVLIVKKGKKKRKPLIFVKIEDFRFYNCLPSNDSILVLHKGIELTITFANYENRVLWMEHFNQARNIHLSTINCENKFIKWTEIEMGQTLVPLMNHDGCFMKNNVYFFGGCNSSLMPCSALIEYDLNLNNWSIKSSPVQPRIGHTMTTLGSKIYICFGFNKDQYYSNIWEFDGNQWKSINLEVEIHLAFHTTVPYNNKLVVFGGKNENGFSNRMYFIDPTDGSVVLNESKDPPSGRANHSAIIYSNKMVVIGGEINMVDEDIVGDVFVYQFKQNAWHKMKNATIKPRVFHRAILLKGYIFIIGGSPDIINDNLEQLPNECIDPVTWEKVDFNEFGNVPLGISHFAIAGTSKTSAIICGRIDSVTKMPFASSWMFDIEEGFYQNHSKK